MPAETATSDGASDFTRLHISPLDPDLLKIVLPTAVAAQARNISYHSIDTFPERRYGYVELPSMEADKLKKKLNGSVLKGTKLRVEKARPEHRTEPTGEHDEEEEIKKTKKAKKASDAAEASRKRKRDRDVVEGVAISDRKIKRGWTEPADQRRKKSKKDKEKEKEKDNDKEGGPKTTEKKKRQKSKYTDGEECLLKTKLPPNAVGNLTEDNMPKKRKKKGNAREVVVHEFEKTTKFPSFLKTVPEESRSNGATEFVDGKGWVDSEGGVVEAVKAKPASAPAVQKPKRSKPAVKVVEEEDDSTSSSGTSSSGSSDEESDEESEAESKPATKEEKVDDETSDSSDSDSSSDSSSDSDSDEESPVQASHTTPISTIKADHSRPMSASSTRSLTIKIPPPITPSASSKVHPLEALYKRNKASTDANAAAEALAQEPQPFSFFGGGDDLEEEEDREHPKVPMTPYTRQDLEWRNTRSAAPTPDTAHPTRMRNFWTEDDDDDDADMHDVVEEDEEEEGEDAEGGNNPQQPSSSSQGGAASEFQSWFWDNRRDLNRSWMSRRKTVAKEKRHRENKARASKAV